jgi:hypothetical protein
MVISFNSSPTIDAWSYHLIHHLRSYHLIHQLPWINSSCHMIHQLLLLHGHILWCITYHRSYYLIHHVPLIHIHFILCITYHRLIVLSYDTSPTVISYNTLVVSSNSSPIIDKWSYHLIHHLPSINFHVVIWYFTFHWPYILIHHLPSMHVMSYDMSPTIDAWSYHLIHHLLSMHGHII